DEPCDPARAEPLPDPAYRGRCRAHERDATPSAASRPDRERAARRCRPAARVVLAERDRPVAMAEAVERQDALVSGYEALHLRRVGVKLRVEAPHDVAAGVVLHLLHLQEDLAALLAVGCLLRLVIERDELLVRGVGPVRLVVGGIGQTACRNLRQVVARAPEVG